MSPTRSPLPSLPASPRPSASFAASASASRPASSEAQLARVGVRRSRRAFTLLEAMAVVVIIGIASAAALPSFTERVRERRSSQAAEEIALLYKMARARALGRGAAQMVELTPGISGGMNVTFKVREAIQQNDAALTVGTCGPLPLTTCYNDWSAVAVGNNRLVDQFPRDGALYANLEAKLYATAASNDGAVVGQVCFTPSGRAFTRADAGGVWAPVIEIPRIQVKRYVFGTTDKYVGLTRTVLLPPSGAARLAL